MVNDLQKPKIFDTELKIKGYITNAMPICRESLKLKALFIIIILHLNYHMLLISTRTDLKCLMQFKHIEMLFEE